VTRDDVLNRFQILRLDFEPGAKYRYCYSGYFLLAVIIEEVSGKSYREFLEERIFTPTGLKHTFCDTNARLIPHRATGYSRWGGTLKRARYITLKQTVGAGNLASTVGDLLIWPRMLANGGLLKEKSIKSMMSRGKLNDGKQISYGHGLVISRYKQHLVIRHGGGISGFRAELAYFPKSDYTIVVLANCESTNTAKIANQIASLLLSRDHDVDEGQVPKP